MQSPPIPADEGARVAALRRYDILDTPAEVVFDRVVRIAAAVLGVPISLVSLVDDQRQWFKSRVGLDAAETPRAISFCGHAILGDDVMVVPDATLDPRFADNPLVTGPPDIRFYAGAPLTTSDGFKIGTLCVIDQTPGRVLSEVEQAVLTDLAAIVVDELELRLAARQLLEQRTELLHAQEVATQAGAAKAALLSRVSHELRTPLAAIKGFAELLSLEPLPDPAAGYVTHIVTAGDRLGRLVDDLLDLGATEIVLHAEPVVLDDAVRAVVRLLRARAAQSGIELRMDVGQIAVEADPARLGQVLANLVANAVVHHTGDGVVTIRARVEPTAVWVEVVDDGPGIDPDRLARLFEPMAVAGGGTSTGLPVARRLVEAMHGELGIESAAGVGTRAWFWLPHGSA